MWDYLYQLSYWDWLAFGSLLLIFEVFGVGGWGSRDGLCPYDSFCRKTWCNRSL